MTREEHAEYLNRLTEVRWDRCVISPCDQEGYEDQEYHTYFGWVEREDGRADYVEIQFVPWGDRPGFTTSSAEFSKEYAERLYGPGNPHYPCQRIEHVLGDLVQNKIVLAEAP